MISLKSTCLSILEKYNMNPKVNYYYLFSANFFVEGQYILHFCTHRMEKIALLDIYCRKLCKLLYKISTIKVLNVLIFRKMSR